MFWAYAQGHLPTARLWRESLTRFTVSDRHRQTVKDLKLPPYPLKNARIIGWSGCSGAGLRYMWSRPSSALDGQAYVGYLRPPASGKRGPGTSRGAGARAEAALTSIHTSTEGAEE
jgi:hypothetical protein